jgi:DNA-binding response OmpR family regulator
MKILVLDDDADLSKSLKVSLEQYSHEVHCSMSAKDAIDMVNQHVFDVMLVDYKMPENDGIWFMKNAKIPKTTKVLLITSYANREIINKMFAVGASGYLIKPFGENDLMRHINFLTARNNSPASGS